MTPEPHLHGAHLWGFPVLTASLLLAALAVNRVAPQKRRHVRRALILYALYAVAFGSTLLLQLLGRTAWSEHVGHAADLLEACAFLNIAGLLTFDLFLPAVGLEMVSIMSDVTLGVGYAVALVVQLHAAGIEASSVVATSAVVSGVLALSLQTTLGNIIGGMALQLDGSVHVGDWIALENGKQGKVREIRWRHTVLETRDWDTIVVPNSSLLSSNITILGKRSSQPIQHRMWVYFNVDFRYAPSHVIDVVLQALLMAPIDGVALTPQPSVICYDFAKDGRDSFGYYAVRYWLTDLASDDPTSSKIRCRIYAALKRAGIPLARPTQTLFISPEEGHEEQHQRHVQRQREVVRSVNLFESLNDQELDFLAHHLVHSPFTAGETITHKGAVAHWLYLLARGRAEVVVVSDAGARRAVKTLEAPSFFGEMGLMTGEPRMADVVALTDVDCYRLDKSAFEKTLLERPEMASALATLLAKRRVELEAVRDGLDAEAQKNREKSEQSRILAKIEEFFGLGDTKA